MPRRQEVEMANLPSEVVIEHVLVGLPLPKIFEFRMVCRSWAAYLTSAAFLRASSTHWVRRDEEACLLMAQRLQGCLSEKTLVAYFPSLRRHVKLPLHPNFCNEGMSITSPLNSSQQQREEEARPLDLRSVSVKAMASAGGLICAIIHDLDYVDLRDYSVLVFNPLNGSLKVLPSPQHKLLPITSTHMLVDRNLLSYKVFLHFRDVHRFSLQVYDSLEGSWTSIDTPNTCPSLAHDIAHADLHFWDNSHKTIYGYHVYADVWSTAYFNTKGKGLFPSDKHSWSANFESPCIMAYNGRLIFALIIRKIRVDNQKIHLSGFAVYELQVSKDGHPLHWKKIAQTPDQMLEENCFSKEFMSFSCNPKGSLVHNQKLICMMCSCTKKDPRRGGHLTLSVKQLLNPIAYDLEDDKWLHMPNYKGRQDMAGLFSCKLAFNSFP